ncbi:MAG: ELWxxDGT repeat protein [Vicinamibacteria bacterium]
MRTNHFVRRALLSLSLIAAPASPSLAQGGGPFPLQVLDISPGVAPSDPRSMVVMGGVAYFAATDPSHGTELWRSDGTPAGTVLVSDIRPGADSSSPGDLGASFPGVAPADLTVVGDQLFFIANDGVHGIELWVSDGTPGGTHLVLDLVPGASSSYPRSLTAVGDTLFFAGCTYDAGCELWRSDGTESGTTLVKDIRAGSASSLPKNMAVLGDLLIFAADNGLIGEELWKSDGTASGTVLLKDVDPTPLVYPPDGNGRSNPSGLTTLGSVVMFVANDGSHGYELWRTDGTTAGTTLVLDLSPGSDSGAYTDGPIRLVGDRVAFLGRTSASGLDSMYRGALSDGTAAGTYVTGNYLTQGPWERTKLGNFHYFAKGGEDTGSELGRSSLTGLDSEIFVSIAPGSASASPTNLVTIGDRIFFSANDQSHGIELWQSDGTVAGTTRVTDINPGIASSSPSKAIQLGDRVLFTATDGVSGVELWSFSLNRPPVARAGADLELASGGAAHLDGSASSDPESAALTYDWRDESDFLLSTDAAFTTGLPDGVHVLKLTVSDGESSSVDTVQVTVGDTRPLTISIHAYDNAQGLVSLNQPPATCASIGGQLTTTCIVTPDLNSTVTLTATPTGHSTFLGWSEASCGYAMTCTLTIARAKDVAASFVGPYILSIQAESIENGDGKVSGFFGAPPTASPFECAAVVGSNTTCDYPLEQGTLVTLTATPDVLSVLDSLSPCPWDLWNPTAPPCSPGAIFQNATIIAKFRRVAPPAATVRIVSVDQGFGSAYLSVTSAQTGDTAGVMCQGVGGVTTTCSLPAQPGDAIMINGMPDEMSILTAISGCESPMVYENGGSCPPGQTMGSGDAAFEFTFKGPRIVTVKSVSFESGAGDMFVSTQSGFTQCEGVVGTTQTCTLPVRIGTTPFINFMAGPTSVIKTVTGCAVDFMDLTGGGCTPTPIGEDTTITVTFRGPQTVTLDAVGVENGSGELFLSTSNEFVPCGNLPGTTKTCTASVRIGTMVNVGSMAQNHSVVTALTGCVSDVFPGGATCAPFQVTDPLTLTATFRGPQPITLNLTSLHDGAGSVTLNGPGQPPVTCQTTANSTVSCAGVFGVGETVYVSGLPGPSSGVTAQIGCSAYPQPPNGMSCEPLVVTGATSISVTFGGAVSLTVNHSSSLNGQGSVSISPFAMPADCFLPLSSNPGPCSVSLYAGMSVTLAASPASPVDGVSPSTFDGWSDACLSAGTDPECTLSVTADIAVTAGFRGPRSVNLTFSGSGSGIVGLSSGAQCASPTPCSRQVPTGSLDLIATPDGGSTFQSWVGACAGQGPNCSLVIANDDVSTQAIFVLTNHAPVASHGGPYSGVRNLPIVFDGAGSSDADGDPLTYAWDFGDGAVGSGVAPAHAYATAGTFTVTLAVNDGTTGSAPATSTVTITNQAPTANAGAAHAAFRNQSVAFTGAASSDPDGDTLTYSWNFGDGGTATGVTPSHTYATSGAFTVTLTVNDGTTTSAASTSTSTITNRAPVANRGAATQTGTRLAAIAFNGSASSDADGDTLSYLWNFGDGTTGTGATPSHLYATVGAFTVTLTVNDGIATSAPVTATVTITNLAPTVTFTSPAAGSVFLTTAAVTLTADPADPDGTVSKVEFFAGSTKLGERLTAPWSLTWPSAASGTYALTAKVTDSNSATVTSASVSVIRNAPPTVALTAPANNAQYASGASITLTASATDADGTIASVQFFRDGMSLGTDSSSPYTVAWTGAVYGSYALTAVATDNRGAFVTSSVINVKVTAAGAPIADAEVRGSNTTTNYGAATTFAAQQASATTSQRWTYLKFDLSSLPAIGNAKVRVYGAVSAKTSTAIQTGIYSVSDTTWTEGGIKWNNKPGSGPAALSSVSIVVNSTSARWYELDVTAYLQAEKAAGRNVVTLVLKNLANSGPYVQFTSKEGTAANRPQVLVVP